MRIAGITIPEQKRLEIGLTAVYGVGRVRAHEILTEAKIPFSTKPKDLNAEQEARVNEIVSKYRIEGDLRRDVSQNIKRHKDIGTYRGTRHVRRLPVRGQGTKTNSRTVRGNVRKTMTSGRRTVEKT